MKIFKRPYLWAHSEGHPHTQRHLHPNSGECGDLRRNPGEYQGSSREYGVVGLPKFAKLRMKARTCFWYALEPA